MSITEITNKVNTLGNAWENMQRVNDARLREIEKKGSADPLLMTQLERLNQTMDNQKSRMNSLETAVSRPVKELKHYQTADAGVVSEYKNAFNEYIRKGNSQALDSMEIKSLSVGTDADGGYLVTPSLSQNIEKIVFESSPMRQLASVEEISTDTLEVVVDNDSMAAGWTTETGAVADTTTAQIDKRVIETHELYAQPKATQKLIDDAAVDIEAWIAEKVSEIFSRTENSAFINGTGIGQPTGILSYAAGTSWGQIEQIDSGSAGAVTADSLINLYYSLKDDYARNATFLMNRSVMQSVRLLKESSTDQYIWQPGLADGAPDTLLGVPVMQAADMPTAAADSLSVAVGDFRRGYKVVDRVGIRILRDPFTDKPFVKFYTTKRVGGEVVNFEAIKLLKLSV